MAAKVKQRATPLLRIQRLQAGPGIQTAQLAKLLPAPKGCKVSPGTRQGTRFASSCMFSLLLDITI